MPCWTHRSFSDLSASARLILCRRSRQHKVSCLWGVIHWSYEGWLQQIDSVCMNTGNPTCHPSSLLVWVSPKQSVDVRVSGNNYLPTAAVMAGTAVNKSSTSPTSATCWITISTTSACQFDATNNLKNQKQTWPALQDKHTVQTSLSEIHQGSWERGNWESQRATSFHIRIQLLDVEDWGLGQV